VRSENEVNPARDLRFRAARFKAGAAQAGETQVEADLGKREKEDHPVGEPMTATAL
jgi:hypothetical protein